jgi:hypothetical protein
MVYNSKHIFSIVPRLYRKIGRKITFYLYRRRTHDKSRSLGRELFSFLEKKKNLLGDAATEII